MTYAPEGHDPSEPGDCANPRSITIEMTEDRWGNHRIRILKAGTVVGEQVVLWRESTGDRMGFSNDMNRLHLMLRTLEAKECI